MKTLAMRGRWAVAAMFFANGFLVGSWAPQIPVLLERLGISETTLGVLILLFGLGAIVAMPSCGLLMSRHGSRRVLQFFAIASAAGLIFVALAPNVWLAGAALVFFGAVVGGTDVAMNTNAVAAERKLARAIMSSSHGFWSLGGFFGSALGGLTVLRFGFLAHAALVSAAVLAIVLVANLHLVEDERSATTERKRRAMPSNPVIYLIGLMALMSMIPEGAILDWAALYLQQERGANIAAASFAFAAFSAMMALMRFVGDAIRNRLGAVVTLRISSVIAAAGLCAAALAPEAWMAVAAFAFSGLGIANMVPIAFSAAGNQQGISSGAGMSVVTTMGYSGILVAPSAIGFIGDRTGFAPIFMVLALFLVVVFLMAGLARSADFEAVQPAE